jgi:hypothetical protein
MDPILFFSWALGALAFKTRTGADATLRLVRAAPPREIVQVDNPMKPFKFIHWHWHQHVGQYSIV